MPAFAGKLTDEQIWEVLAYIKAQWPQEIAQRHTEIFKDK
jgi:mono/diheme cytochrome c family protein